MIDVPVVILCGGMGMRLREETAVMPKPMVTVGGRPILWHIMKYYSSYGFRRFILCLGYKGDVIKQYFRDESEPWQISFIDTGRDAMTGARIKRAEPYIESQRFMLTYGDGLSDVDLGSLLEFHIREGKLATVTSVHPPSRFGLLTLEGAKVVRFAEKAHAPHDYINGGFFVCDRGVFSYLEDDDSCTFEGHPLEWLAADGELVAYRHESFWQCMDTQRDRDLLEEAWSNGARWKRW